MEISGVSRVLPVAFDPGPVQIDRAAANREVVQAVKAVNQGNLLGDQNQLTFQQDPRTQRVIVRVVNRESGEVISQIPSETVIGLAAELKRLSKC